jgi:dipeptidyl aminopeptidase/acylaminoacyl peptidase
MVQFGRLSLALIVCSAAFAQDKPGKTDPLAVQQYIKPPQEIVDAVLAPWYLNVSVGNLSPDRKRYIVVETNGMPPLALLGKPYANLGGLQVDLKANRARHFTTSTAYGLKIRDLADSKEVEIQVPAGVTVSDPRWAPDGSKVAFFGHGDGATRIYVADASTGKVRRLTRRPCLATLCTGFEWTKAGTEIAVVLIPRPRQAEPVKPSVAVNPRVRVSDNKAVHVWTYPSLLDGPYDDALLEYYATGQLATVDVASGKVQEIGKPAMIESVGPAPSGDYFRVTTMTKPFSYIVPMDQFGRRTTIWDVKGTEKAEIESRPLRLGEEPGKPPDKETPKRDVSWRPDGAGLSFIQSAPEPKRGATSKPGEEASDDATDAEQGRRQGGRPGPGGEPPSRPDRVMLWQPPFGQDDVKTVYEAKSAIQGLAYSPDCKTLFLTQSVGGKTRISAVSVEPNAKPVVLAEYDPEDLYAGPGELVTKPGPKAGSVVRISADGKSAYFSGTTYFKKPEDEAPRPFIDRVNLADGKKTRLFESKADLFETPTMLDDEAATLLVTRQSDKVFPNTFLVDRTSGQEMQLTQNKDYLPDISQARRDTVKVTRADGFTFEVRVWTPQYAVTGRGLPAFFWFYPGEVENQAAYDKGKRTFNKNLYPRVGASSVQLFLREGYVVVEPDCPIVGPPGKQNDEYVSQLLDNLSATIDELDRRMMIDRRRLAIGGHSYGAFSTANALVHTPFFKAGIAGDGNYNRSLTPFGFQAEGRELWDDRELYETMSPLFYVEHITGALLMYHGMDDQNVGTDPTNSVRMFQALESLGKPAAMYMYPYEDHGQIALETRLDIWARWVAWLDKWVKNAKR